MAIPIERISSNNEDGLEGSLPSEDQEQNPPNTK